MFCFVRQAVEETNPAAPKEFRHVLAAALGLENEDAIAAIGFKLPMTLNGVRPPKYPEKFTQFVQDMACHVQTKIAKKKSALSSNTNAENNVPAPSSKNKKKESSGVKGKKVKKDGSKYGSSQKENMWLVFVKEKMQVLSSMKYTPKEKMSVVAKMWAQQKETFSKKRRELDCPQAD